MIKLPKIVGDTWFNSKPISPQDLKGKVVLIDFWTYTCVNCLRSLPHLHRLWHKYKDKGLLMIGIHTPEFEFEKNPDNVKQAINEYRVHWPVVLDNDYINWRSFANRYWPAKYIADKSGNIVYEHFGEGGYKETEETIANLISGKTGGLPLIEIEEEHIHDKVCFIPTPELYCGYGRGTLSNPSYYNDQEAEYFLPEVLMEDSIALAGKFFASYEYVESRQEKSAMFLDFTATEVNLVMRPVEVIAEIEIWLNDHIIAEEMSGKDICSSGIVKVNEPKMYNLLKSSFLTDGVLKVVAKKNNFQAYAFTFSGCST